MARSHHLAPHRDARVTMPMTRRSYYGFVIAALAGMVLGLLELGYRLTIDTDDHMLGPRPR